MITAIRFAFGSFVSLAAVVAVGCAEAPTRRVPADSGVGDGSITPVANGLAAYHGDCVEWPGGALAGRDFVVMVMPPADGGVGAPVSSFAIGLGDNFHSPATEFFRLFVAGAPIDIERRTIQLGDGTPNANLATCQVCALLYVNCTGGTCVDTYFPRNGVAYVTTQASGSGDDYIVKVADAEFYPVTVDESAPSTTADVSADPPCIYLPAITLGAIAETPGQDGGSQFADTLDNAVLRTVGDRL